jgi:hypothetical protein
MPVVGIDSACSSGRRGVVARGLHDCVPWTASIPDRQRVALPVVAVLEYGRVVLVAPAAHYF